MARNSFILAAFVVLRTSAAYPGHIDVDVRNFFRQASAAVAGQRPYAEFHFEYPPGALLLMLLPRLLTADLQSYTLLFQLQLALIDLLTLAALGRLVRRLRGRRSNRRKTSAWSWSRWPPT